MTYLSAMLEISMCKHNNEQNFTVWMLWLYIEQYNGRSLLCFSSHYSCVTIKSSVLSFQFLPIFPPCVSLHQILWFQFSSINKLPLTKLSLKASNIMQHYCKWKNCLSALSKGVFFGNYQDYSCLSDTLIGKICSCLQLYVLYAPWIWASKTKTSESIFNVKGSFLNQPLL